MLTPTEASDYIASLKKPRKPTEEELEIYEEWRKNTSVENLKELPTDVFTEIQEIILPFLLKMFGDVPMYLGGSYAKGCYVRKDTPKHLKEIKKLIRYTNKISDFDVVLDCEDMTYGFIYLTGGIKLDLQTSSINSKVIKLN